jgi:hypothetical protein
MYCPMPTQQICYIIMNASILLPAASLGRRPRRLNFEKFMTYVSSPRRRVGEWNASPIWGITSNVDLP